MSIQRLPTVSFSLELQRIKLAKMLEQHLAQAFGPVRLYRRALFLLPVSVLALDLPNGTFAAAISRQKRFHRDWNVRVRPLEYMSPIRNLPDVEAPRYAKDLRAVSDRLNTLLTNFPGITRLRWYFEGWDPKKPAVLTPAELPWLTDVSGLPGGPSQKTS